MDFDDFLQGCLIGLLILLVSILTFFQGYYHGENSFQKEAVQRNFGRFELNTHNQAVFRWNEKI